MNRISFAFLLLGAMLCRSLGAAPVPTEQIWQGKLSFQGAEFTLIVRFAADSKGALTGSLDVPEQGVKAMKCSSVALDAKSFKWAVAAIGATYEGKLSADRMSATGDYKQSGVTIPLTMRHVDKVEDTSPKRPQNPTRPYPYLDEVVTYPNPDANVTLSGTLTMPKTGGPFAAVILIAGSGPQDRDETLMGHKPFLVLSDYLTRRGLAVLRVDKRGIGKSTGDYSKATTKDFASDAKAGIEYLKTRKEIDRKRIGLLGHSEGGLVAPMVAAADPDVSFVVMMAGPGVDGEEIIVKQSELIAKAQGAKQVDLDRERAVQRKIFAILRSQPDDKKAQEAMATLLVASQPKPAKGAPDNSAFLKKMAEGQARQMTGPWMRFFAAYDPRPALRKLKVPVLVANGSLDLQVPPDQNLPEIDKALKAGGNARYQISRLPGLNHLFQKCRTGSPNEYARIDETIDPSALQTFGDWILKVTGP